MTKKPLDVETLWKIPRVGAPVPSPDGASVYLQGAGYQESFAPQPWWWR